MAAFDDPFETRSRRSMGSRAIASSATSSATIVEIEIHPFDETNARIRPKELAGMIREAGDGMVMFVGVHRTNSPTCSTWRSSSAISIFRSRSAVPCFGNDVDAGRQRCRRSSRESNGPVALRRRSGRPARDGLAGRLQKQLKPL